MAIPTVLVSSPACNQHDTGAGHPEGRARLPGILDAVRADPALGEDVLERVLAPPVELEHVLRVHTREHVERMRAAAERAAANRVITWLDPDTAVSPASYEAALAAVGCAVEAADRVARGLARTAFALTRPPGHHATPGEAMGFCLFNNVAIAARYLKARHGVERALIVDWDVHHGNGTQEVFWEDPSVYYLSLHLWPHYPGTGAASERGAGAGEGTTRNVPLPYGTSARTYRACFDEALRGRRSRCFRPRWCSCPPGSTASRAIRSVAFCSSRRTATPSPSISCSSRAPPPADVPWPCSRAVTCRSGWGALPPTCCAPLLGCRRGLSRTGRCNSLPALTHEGGDPT